MGFISLPLLPSALPLQASIIAATAPRIVPNPANIPSIISVILLVFSFPFILFYFYSDLLVLAPELNFLPSHLLLKYILLVHLDSSF